MNRSYFPQWHLKTAETPNCNMCGIEGNYQTITTNTYTAHAYTHRGDDRTVRIRTTLMVNWWRMVAGHVSHEYRSRCTLVKLARHRTYSRSSHRICEYYSQICRYYEFFPLSRSQLHSSFSDCSRLLPVPSNHSKLQSSVSLSSLALDEIRCANRSNVSARSIYTAQYLPFSRSIQLFVV